MNRSYLFLSLVCLLSTQPLAEGTILAQALSNPPPILEGALEKILPSQKGPPLLPQPSSSTAVLPQIPLELPAPDINGKIQLFLQSRIPRTLTIHSALQRHLEDYLKNHGNPVAAVVLVEVKTGNILAMAQGKSPKEWHSVSHTALHEYFPAASIFKFVSTLAALDGLRLGPQFPLPLNHRCGDVRPSDFWSPAPTKRKRKPSHQMSLDDAFGHSCNAYFAKLGALNLGLPAITHYAEIFGWAEGNTNTVKTDFMISPSPFHPSPANQMELLDLGELAAGLGPVEMSPIHAAAIMLLLANNGVPKQLNLFEESANTLLSPSAALFNAKTSSDIRTIMHKTVQGGTATSVFHKRAYGYLREHVGAKTGTRMGRLDSFPKNTPGNGLLSTWLTAVYPYDKPEVVVAAVVANGGDWQIKGSHLAAEALRQWDAARRGLLATAEKPIYKTKSKRKGKRRHMPHHALSRRGP